MSVGRISTFLDIYIQRDLNEGTLTEDEAQELIDHLVMKFRMVKFARIPSYNELFTQPSSTGAIGWVNSNILNVAVTRAKKRVYFIGDYEVWSRQNRNFSPEIICFSEEDTGLQRIHFSELPDFGEIEAMEETPDLEFPGAEDSQVEYLLEEDEIDPENNGTGG